MKIVTLILLIFCNCQIKLDKLKFGSNLWPGYELFYVAEANGKFQDLPVHLVEFSSATEVLRSYRNNQINSAGLTMDEVFYLKKYSKSPRVIMILDISNGADILVAQSHIESLKSLRGKKIGVENTAIGAYLLYRIIEMGGLSLSDVQVVHLEMHEHLGAFRAKQVDAVLTFTSQKTAFLKEKGKIVFDSSMIPGEITDVLVVEDSFLQKNRDTVKSFVREWFHGLENNMLARPENLKFISKRELIEKKDVEDTLKLLHIPNAKENLEMLGKSDSHFIQMSENLADYMYEKRLVAERYNLEEIIDKTILEELLLGN